RPLRGLRRGARPRDRPGVRPAPRGSPGRRCARASDRYLRRDRAPRRPSRRRDPRGHARLVVPPQGRRMNPLRAYTRCATLLTALGITCFAAAVSSQSEQTPLLAILGLPAALIAWWL